MKQVQSFAPRRVLITLLAITLMVVTSLGSPSAIGVGAAPYVDDQPSARFDSQAGKGDDPQAALGDEVTQIPFPATSMDLSAVTANRVSAATGPAGAVAEIEPNNVVAAAQPLTSTTIKLTGNIQPNTDEDFYVFTPTVASRLYAAVQTNFSSGGSGLSGDATLEIYGPDGTTLLEGDNDDGTFAANAPSIAGLAVTAARHYIKVRHSSPALLSEINPYDLYLHMLSGSPTAEAEPNNLNGTPNALPASGWVAGTINPAGPPIDNDVYSLSLNAGDTVFLSLDADPERDSTTFNPRLAFGPFDNSFLLIDGSAAVAPNSEAYFMTVKNAGTYRVYVDTAVAGAGPSATYQLSVSVYPQDNARACTTYTSTNVPQTIPVAAGAVVSTLTVPGNPKIGNLKVNLNITHSALGELDVSLIAPDGNEVVLFDDPPAAAAGTSAPQIDVTLDDEAGVPITIYGINKPIIYQPDFLARLAWFKNQNAGGTWTLVIRDDAGTGSGTLNGWGITVCEDPPLPVCPVAATNVFSTDFESGAAGFTHAGSGDEWELGLPSSAPITTCRSGSNCWKTDLDNTYNNAPSGQRLDQELISPNINLSSLAGATTTLEWAMKYNIESSAFDNAYVEVREVGGSGRTKRVWEWAGPTMGRTVGSPAVTLYSAAGWGVWQARISEFAGSTVQVVFHLDSDDTVALVGMAVDDVRVSACPLNTAPVNSVPAAQSTNEDTPLVFGAANSISTSDSDAGTTLPVRVALTSTVGVVTLASTSGLTFYTGDGSDDAAMGFSGTIPNINAALTNLIYRPNANYNGPASLTIETNDQDARGALNDIDTVSITVNPVNDEPSFTASNPPVVNQDAGPQTVSNWAVFNPGPPDEAAQTPTYLVSNVSNPALFSAGPSVAPNGTLSYTPAPGASGSSTFQVVVQDNGGTANGGDDTSTSQTFTISVTAAAATATGTATQPPTATSTAIATNTATAVATSTATVQATNTSTTVPTGTATQPPTATSTAIATSTATAVATSTATLRATSTGTAVATGTATVVATNTATQVVTNTPTSTGTAVSGQPFIDVPPGHTFYSYIELLRSRGVISGYDDNTFRPFNPITRGQIAKVVALAAGFSEAPGEQIYSDVPPSHPFFVYINQLTNRGIVSGYPCPQLQSTQGGCDPENAALFRPQANATRGQLAKIVSNAAGFTEAVSGQVYADVPPTGEGSQFYEWIMRLTNRGVISGYTCGTPGRPCDAENRPYFNPSADVTRGQAAKIVANTFFAEEDLGKGRE